jgi:hypothetical protein
LSQEDENDRKKRVKEATYYPSTDTTIITYEDNTEEIQTDVTLQKRRAFGGARESVLADNPNEMKVKQNKEKEEKQGEQEEEAQQ